MIESYDGLCGIIATFASSSNRLRCNYELGHHGPCSFEKHRSQFRIMGGCGPRDWLRSRNEDGESRGFVQSVVNHNQKIEAVIINDDGDIVQK